MPWVYLHALKDYADMIAYLEMFPRARATFNFSPVLLEQILDYRRQLDAHAAQGIALVDPLLNALASHTLPRERDERKALIDACMRVNRHDSDRFPSYAGLADRLEPLRGSDEGLAVLGDGDLADLLVWYHIVWLGETVRETDPRVEMLRRKGKDFTTADRRVLLATIHDVIGGLLGRYSALADVGRIELSICPYSHPILPLLIDLDTAREALPRLPMPLLRRYPGGIDRAHWQISEAISTFRRAFVGTPNGCWLPEGALSTECVTLLGQHGFRWIAAGGAVLRNSLDRIGVPWTDRPGQPITIAGSDVACFFRDDSLSDLIGFCYPSWDAADAVADFVGVLLSAASERPNSDPLVVPIVLDGENAWEWYPNHGRDFFLELYGRLSECDDISMELLSDCSPPNGPPCRLPEIVAGSWVHGTFSTWIGSPQKNLAWDTLGAAKCALDATVVRPWLVDPERLAAAKRQLAYCEGSDWAWWFGRGCDSESAFSRIYESHLQAFYKIIDYEPAERSFLWE